MEETYAIMKPQKYTIDMYALFVPCGRFPKANTKHVRSVKRYSHSKTTPKYTPTLPSRLSAPREVVKMWKTKKKLPIANQANIIAIVW